MTPMTGTAARHQSPPVPMTTPRRPQSPRIAARQQVPPLSTPPRRSPQRRGTTDYGPAPAGDRRELQAAGALKDGRRSVSRMTLHASPLRLSPVSNTQT